VLVQCQHRTCGCDGSSIFAHDLGQVYKIRHFFLFFSLFVIRAARVACSNTSRTPSFVFAEHSRYFWAPIFLRTSSAYDVLVVRLPGWWKVRTCSGVTGFWEVLCSSSIVFWSKRKSFLQPTRMMGRPWQKCRTSEIHCAIVSHQLYVHEARGPYLLLHVVKRIGRVDGEANQDNMRVGV